jgi:hypothetical protein
MKNNNQSTEKLTNFISEDLIQWLLWYWTQLPNKIDTGQRYRSFLHHTQPWAGQLKIQLESLIAPYEQNFELITALIADDYAPGGVHSDGWIECYQEPGPVSKTYLIPLQFEGEQSTVIFNETSDRAISFNKYTGMGDAGLVTYSQVDPSEVLDTSKLLIDKELHNKYLEHIPLETLAGLTVNSVLDWTLGSAVSWPRKNFHCSGSFLPNNNRISLILMTCQKNEA